MVWLLKNWNLSQKPGFFERYYPRPKPGSPELPVTAVAGGQDYDVEQLNSLLSETIEDEEIRNHLIHYYGSRSLVIQEIMQEKGSDRLNSKYPFTAAEVVYVCRYEMAVKVDDVLSRRLRLSFLVAVQK